MCQNTSACLKLKVGGSSLPCKHQNLPYLYFDSRHRKKLSIHANIHQQILLAKFHEDLTSPGGVDSIFKSTPGMERCIESFSSISDLKVKIWQIFLFFYKVNWNSGS